MKPKMLIVSFSDIANDARVRKQIDLFAAEYEVTTCGWGEKYRADIEHLKIFHKPSKLRDGVQAWLLRFKLFRLAFGLENNVRTANKALRGKRFDVAISNDLESIVVAGKHAGYDKSIADMHEFWPGLHDQVTAWVKIRKPYYEWILRKYVKRAHRVVTVSQTIAEKYLSDYAIACSVVRNATPFHDLKPTIAQQPIKIVHSGGAQANRRPEVMINAVAKARNSVTLDMFLTGENTPYWKSLELLAKETNDKVKVHPPKPYAELIETLNKYDVGIHILPPTSTNNLLALPNKFFDYIQARIGVLVGPTPDMQKRTETLHIGVTAKSFSEEDVTEAIEKLTLADVERWKKNAHAAAPNNHSQAELEVLSKVVSETVNG